MSNDQGMLRIIAGKWRSRKITFDVIKGLRPTTNVTRETLFNWLMNDIVGANCLDLFAGSGALGFEALSRGANSVLMVDAAAKVILKLKENAKLLDAENVKFLHAVMPKGFSKIDGTGSFNIVFIDPPFHQNLIAPVCQKLAGAHWLAENALIYIEAEKGLNLNDIVPKNWKLLRQKIFGQAMGSLFSNNMVE